MKKLILSIALISFAFGFAQNEDKMTKTVTTKTKVKSSKGEEVAIKEKKYTAEQKLEVENNNQTNQAVRRDPVKIIESTTFVTQATETVQAFYDGAEVGIDKMLLDQLNIVWAGQSVGVENSFWADIGSIEAQFLPANGDGPLIEVIPQ